MLILSCLSFSQNLFWTYMDYYFLFVSVHISYIYTSMWETARQQKASETAISFWQFDSIMFFLPLCMCLCVYATSAGELTDYCSALWQTVPLNHAAVVTCSDRTTLLPWDSSIGVSHALNEEINMLSCLLEMKRRGCLNAECHVWYLHKLVPLLEAICIIQQAHTAKSHLCSWNR